MKAGSIAARVALATAVTVALSALVVAIVGVALASELGSLAEDDRLRDAASMLAIELEEEGAQPAQVAEDEAHELEHTAIRIAIDEGGERVAGDELVPSLEPDQCASRGSIRACAMRAGDRVAIAARDAGEAGHDLTSVALAIGIAVLLTTLLGAMVAGAVARLSLAPLAQLHRAVERIDPDAPAATVLGAASETVEVEALRSTLAALLERLSASLASARRFAADAAHELRTPLTAVQGELELIAERAQLDETDRASLARLRTTTARLSTLVERLLVLARPDAGAEGFEEVDLGDVVEDVVLTLSADARERVRVTRASEPSMRGDAALLASMLGNALENALKFSPESSPVTIDVRSEAARIVVEITDEGPGISPHERALLFQPFRRASGARARGIAGHGIGLALIAHVARLHGGTAAFVDGAPGARLRIELPRGLGSV